jgi:hypothetical protein
MHVGVGGFYAFVTKPERDDGDIHASQSLVLARDFRSFGLAAMGDFVGGEILRTWKRRLP